MQICPSVGSISPAIHFIIVVFPHPEGPNKTKKFPESISTENFVTASIAP